MNLFLRMIGTFFGVLVTCDILIEFWLWRAVVWLEEWFDVPQKRVEQASIVLYLIFANLPISKLFGVTLAITLSVAALMYMWHRKPAAIRGFNTVWSHLLRILLVCPLMASAVVLLITNHDVFFLLAQTMYLLTFYITDMNTNGTPGRRRRLAMAELKKLFGDITWLPKPAEAGV